MSNLLSKDKVIEILNNLKLNNILEIEYLYDVYKTANEVVKYLSQQNAQIEVK